MASEPSWPFGAAFSSVGLWLGHNICAYGKTEIMLQLIHLAAATGFLASVGHTFAHPDLVLPRQSAPTALCPDLQIPSGSGGRKIAVVIDSSSSNHGTDPDDLRVAAGRSLADVLVSTAEATADLQADQLAIVDFDSSATVIYELGDPAAADFSSIDSFGGTSIVSGVEAAVDELTKPESGPTADRAGIVVLTDGQGGSVASLVEQINRAIGLGIRVSFGFLAADAEGAGDPDVLAAILSSSGIYSAFDNAAAQQGFVNLVVSHGLTNGGAGDGDTSTLLAGLSIAAKVDPDGPNTFTYAAQDGEDLGFTVTSVTAGNLTCALSDASGAELATASSDESGLATINVTAPATSELQLSVSASNTSEDATFLVMVNSSLGIASHSEVKLTSETSKKHNVQMDRMW
ncbi:hypothetical protein BDY21DRAFT_361125 [Lineolata rhizophorae]|uniref:VWFA domain-containing protein n=1 Tax=Lineolata rhizophorae TaxID=578093 RepID=A0A6A6PAX7_9PEZI|nr:hypothetical protein BDY21DRAFT_361125 [Lineolata rhizophorae]